MKELETDEKLLKELQSVESGKVFISSTNVRSLIAARYPLHLLAYLCSPYVNHQIRYVTFPPKLSDATVDTTIHLS